MSCPSLAPCHLAQFLDLDYMKRKIVHNENVARTPLCTYAAEFAYRNSPVFPYLIFHDKIKRIFIKINFCVCEKLFYTSLSAGVCVCVSWKRLHEVPCWYCVISYEYQS